jgi:LPXTG-site transpeptidase (sortase) family protein
MSTYTFNEREIRMFLRPAPSRGRLKGILPLVSGALAILVVAAVALSVLQPDSTIAVRTPVLLPASKARPVEDVVATVATPTPEPTPTPLPVTLPNETLAASELSVSAPVIWEVPFIEDAMNSSLEKGVIHIAGTALPGQQGMSAIAGHSSNYPWSKGQFNTVFAPLTKAKIGDTFEINYKGTMYQYKVSKVYEVKPTEVAILSDHSRTGIRLITCTPLGTSLRRLIVEADQVFPDPKYAAPFNGSALNGSLPKDR